MKSFKILSIIGILGVILALFLTFTSYSAPPNDVLEHVKAVKEKHTAKLMEKSEVVGTAVGLSEDDIPVILVLTKKSGVAGIPASLDGIQVKIMETGEITALKKPDGAGKPTRKPSKTNPYWYPRPVPIGVSTGNANEISAGTIGCRVKGGGKFYALSNNHVYVGENGGTDDEVLQPGRYDGGIPQTDYLGTLSNFNPIYFYNDFSEPNPPINTIDAAIAESDTYTLGNATPSDGYGTPSSNTTEPLLSMPVQKYGRTTGLTKGSIIGINSSVKVTYGTNKYAYFIGQIIIYKPGFSKAGDSGALIVTQNGKNPVGLLFAGSNTITIANPIQTVTNYFGVTIDGE